MDGSEIESVPSDLEKGPPQREKYNQQHAKPRNFCPSIYHDQIVKPKLQHRPWLESLHQFMDPSANGFAVDLASNCRMDHFDIKVIHFPKSGKPYLIIKCLTSEDFEAAINDNEEHGGTLVIGKGISRAMIETLGVRFELEPEFFAQYLEGTELFRMGTQISGAPANAPNFLPEYVRRAPFYTVEYRRPYHIEGGQQMVIHLRSTETTTPRGVQIIHRDLPDVFYAEKISVYKRKGSNIVILLTDQLLSTAPPASHILRPVSLFGGNENAESPVDRWRHQVSARRELISWVQRLQPNEAKALFDDHKQLALRPVLKLVESSGAMFLDHARYMMSRILTHNHDPQFPDSIPFFLRISRSLHRYIHLQQKLLRSSLRVASLRGGDDIMEQEQDFSFLSSEMENTLKALEEDVRFFVGEASIQEGKIVGWVSKFAALFLPVSLLATILSINDTGYTRWTILGCLSGPFVFICIYFMFFWKPAYFKAR